MKEQRSIYSRRMVYARDLRERRNEGREEHVIRGTLPPETKGMNSDVMCLYRSRLKYLLALSILPVLLCYWQLLSADKGEMS